MIFGWILWLVLSSVYQLIRDHKREQCFKASVIPNCQDMSVPGGIMGLDGGENREGRKKGMDCTNFFDSFASGAVG